MQKNQPQSDTMRLKVPLPGIFPPFSYQTKVLGLGSCFVESVGKQMQRLKLPVQLNPMGVQYNPLALARVLQYGLGALDWSADEVFESHGVYHHFDLHGLLGHPDYEMACHQMKGAVSGLQQALLSVDRLLITLGTAFVYTHSSTGKTVANCHKLPSAAFRKHRMEPDQIVSELQPVLKACKAARPNLEIIITVSPVRHIRDGVIENQRSKAVLLLATEVLSKPDYVYYFPAYELLMDELRDYRFYEADYAHPSSTAVDYIWSCFGAVAFNDEVQGQLQAVRSVVQSSEHRALYPTSAAHQAFLRKLERRIRSLGKELPGIDFSAELKQINSELLS